MWRLRRKRRSVCLVIACLFFVYFVRTEVAKSYENRRQKESSIKNSVANLMALSFDYKAYIAGEKSTARDNFSKHFFNIESSNSIELHRNVPDSRDPKCRNKIYNIPSTYSVSIVICFHNEARSALLRTIMSLLNRSPKEFLKEIILVDDFSDDELDGWELRKFPKVRIYRNSERQGLIKSRMFGVQKSTGSHVMFLDSHCEVNVDWLYPLLHIIAQHPKALVSPVIDVIEAETFEYKPSSVKLKGGFDWSLNFHWQPVTSAEVNSSETSNFFKSPVTHGGQFLVSKAWFEEIGGLDKELNIWGAENIEVSIKTWLCGGEVLTAPCSRVGHVFRKKHPYSFPPNGSLSTYLRNSKRVAETWLDEYKYQFYELKPQAKQVDMGSLEEILNWKRRSKCKSFQWYLDNIYPELKPLSKDSVALGQLKQAMMCVESKNDASNRMSAILAPCSANQPGQEWHLSTSGELHQGSFCLIARVKMKRPKIYLTKCTNSIKQKWTRRRRLLIFQGMCLENVLDAMTLNPCRQKAFSQQWDFSVELQKWEER